MNFILKMEQRSQQRVLDIINEAPNATQRESQRLTREIGSFGEKQVKKYIADSATPFSKAAQSAGLNSGSGRRRTGRMYNAVSYKVTAFKTKSNILIGWIKPKVPEYYRYQEVGFKNRFKAAYDRGGALRVKGKSPVVRMMPNGEFKMTKGMFAIRDARFDIEKVIPKLVSDFNKDLVRELKRL
jgi:hypothetical protein